MSANFENVSSSDSMASCYPCNPCTPDQVDEYGAQCYPCNPCTPDQLGNGGSQCYPCQPCTPDQRDDDGSQCYPCHPCTPDQRDEGGSQCYPCHPCTPDQGEASYSSSSSSSDGCFITSACVESMGLADDCDELQTLRALRDKRRLYDPKFDALVKEYYKVAPIIVEAIDASPNRKAKYAELYETMVKPCVAMVKENRENEAVELYTQTVLQLKQRYVRAA